MITALRMFSSLDPYAFLPMLTGFVCYDCTSYGKSGKPNFAQI